MLRGRVPYSFVGLAVLQLVVDEPLVSGSGTLGALAVSPALMAKFPDGHAQRARIYHFEPDKLCSWSPENSDVSQSPFQVVLVRNCDNNMDRHFGRDDHSYSHWLWLDSDAVSARDGLVLGRSPPVFHSQSSSALVHVVPVAPCCSLRVWGFSAGSFVDLAVLQLVVDEPLVSGSGTWERLPFHRHSWQSSRMAMPNVFGSIISNPTSCAPAPLKTLMSLSPRSRWSWSATVITTWTGTLAGMAIRTVIGSGWIL